MKNSQLSLCEESITISGEQGAFPMGSWIYLLRLFGCNLRCSYCDAGHSKGRSKREGFGAFLYHTSPELLASKIYAEMWNKGVSQLLLTGGEPLLQDKALAEMLNYLWDNTIYENMPTVGIETNGTRHPSPALRKRVDCFIFDYKMTPSERRQMLPFSHFEKLPQQDMVKFVCGTPYQIKEALMLSKKLQCKKAVSLVVPKEITAVPEMVMRTAKEVYEAIKETEQFDVLMNFQLHKCIGAK